MQRKQAIAEFTRYVCRLADKIPAGTKAAEVRSNLRAISMLEKLAASLTKHQNIITAVNEVFRNKSAAYRHQVVNGLVRGFKKHQAKRAAAPGPFYGALQARNGHLARIARIAGTAGNLASYATIPLGASVRKPPAAAAKLGRKVLQQGWRWHPMIAEMHDGSTDWGGDLPY